MSAYGDIVRAPGTVAVSLRPTLWVSEEHDTQYAFRGAGSEAPAAAGERPLATPVPTTRQVGDGHQHAPGRAKIVLFHLTLASARTFPGLLEYLGAVFAKEVEDGMTYPQEGEMDQEGFEKYFFAADVFVGLVGRSEEDGVVGQGPLEGGIEETRAKEIDDNGPTKYNASGKEISVTLQDVQEGRSWEESIAGFYYVKPNYPGRSSHICNAGFIVPPRQRGLGYGRLLARSYVQNAPRLGYRGSVFNLVYVNNTASCRLWESLGFTKAGVIPLAGRLRRVGGVGELFVDANIYYKGFLT